MTYTLEDYLMRLHTGQWFGFVGEHIYANLVIHSDDAKPTEQECTDWLAALQTTFDNAKTKQESDKTNANNKLKALGLTDDEIKAIKGIK